MIARSGGNVRGLMLAVAPPLAVTAPSTPAEVRHSAAVLWTGGPPIASPTRSRIAARA